MTPRRRDALGLLAGCTAALAGCSDLQEVVGESEPTVAPSAIEELTAGEVPTVDPVVAIDAEEQLVDTHRERVVDLLREVPTPFTADDVPNAAVRKELTDAVDAARERRSVAAEADRREERLRRLRGARASAAFAARAWAAIDGDTTVADVEAAAADLREDLEAAEQDREYLGDDDLVRAVLVHGAIEGRFGDADRRLDPERRRHRRSTGAIAVGKHAETVEAARANLDGATVRYDVYTASLDEPRSRRDRLAAAAGTLRDEVTRRRPDAPGDWNDDPDELVDDSADIERTPAGEALERLYHGARYTERVTEPGANRLASIVLAAHTNLRSTRGFTTLRERIEAGEHRTVTSADDVRALRADAADAIQSALGTTPGERLTRRELVEASETVAYVDRELREDAAHADDPVEVRDLARPLGGYLTVALTATATPAASASVLEALRG